MKPIQAYSPESIDRLRQWIKEMNDCGDTKYYEIFVDGMRIVQKTKDVEEFDRHKVWVGADTQQIKVLTYNTFGSHRSKVFEYRTAKYPDEINYQALAEELQKSNDSLTRRLSDAEAYIQKLENIRAQTTNNENFDLEKILSLVGTISKQFPGLKSSLGGLGGIFEKVESPQEQEKENCEATFKRKSNENTSVDESMNSTNGTIAMIGKEEYSVTLVPHKQPGTAHKEKMHELNQFFTDNPAYIDVVYDLVAKEKSKSAA